MNPSITLNHIKTVTGISRNHLTEIFGYSAPVITKWENDPSAIPKDATETFELLLCDFLEASDALDEANLSWNSVTPLRIAAMRCGVSPPTFLALMRRNKLIPWDFGQMGLWVTHEDVETCRQ